MLKQYLNEILKDRFQGRAGRMARALGTGRQRLEYLLTGDGERVDDLLRLLARARYESDLTWQQLGARIDAALLRR